MSQPRYKSDPLSSILDTPSTVIIAYRENGWLFPQIRHICHRTLFKCANYLRFLVFLLTLLRVLYPLVVEEIQLLVLLIHMKQYPRGWRGWASSEEVCHAAVSQSRDNTGYIVVTIEVTVPWPEQKLKATNSRRYFCTLLSHSLR